jgi:hypothetical protein
MKAFYITIFCISILTYQGYSQPGNRPQPNQQNIEALRVAFLTKQLELTPDEAKKFWPIHDEYEADIKKTMQEVRAKNGDEIELEEKVLAIRKKYKPDFVKAIGEPKFNKMLRVEREFREMIRKELERRRGNQPQGKPMRESFR